MRVPSPVLVIDAAILFQALHGRSRGAVQSALEQRIVVTSERAVEEIQGRSSRIGRLDLLASLEEFLLEIEIVSVSRLRGSLALAQTVLAEAPDSVNGSTRDAHILALAWAAQADIWTTDRDFTGMGVATWSTPNLLIALHRAPA